MEKITLYLRCPKCGKNLSVLVSKGMNINSAKLRCSNELCRYVGKGTEFFTADNAAQKPPMMGNTIPNNSGATEELGTQMYTKSTNISTDMGQIRLISGGAVFPLHVGVNSVGRMAGSYKPNMEPDIKIRTNDMKMSRCHARIDVKRSAQGRGYVFHLQDTSLNGIDLNNREIPRNAVIVLNFGDQMVWGETKVIFEAANGTTSGGEDTLHA